MINKIIYKNSLIILIFLQFIVCCFDLFSLPISVTIWRQAQTMMLTNNFVASNFSIQGLFVNLKGNDKMMMAFEFPLYNFIIGLFFKYFGSHVLIAKSISLLAGILSSILLFKLILISTNIKIAFYSVLFFILLPVDVLMFTSVQPDSLGLMFLLFSLYLLQKWEKSFQIKYFIFFMLSFLLSGLCKFPLIVPYIPVIFYFIFFPKNKFRFLNFNELIIAFFFFIIPFFFWYLIRINYTDPLLTNGSSELNMFLFGDFNRFFTKIFYLKSTIMLFIFIFCGFGILLFYYGIIKSSYLEKYLLFGIFFYYLVIPTVVDQYYYLFAIGPIAAYFIGKGFFYITNAPTYKYMYKLRIIILFGFICFSTFGIIYVLRQDYIFIEASKQINKFTDKNDLIFIINLHDRGNGVGGFNPSGVYFLDRKGWNIQNFNPNNLTEINTQIKCKKDLKWILITWYTSDLEPWYSKYLPKKFERSPSFNSLDIASNICSNFKIISKGRNFAILKNN